MKKFVYLVLILSLASCSVQKRKYQKGFYVSWNKHTINKTQDEAIPKRLHDKVELARTEKESVVVTDNVQLSASGGKTFNFILPKKSKALIKINFAPDSCDNVIFRNGDEIAAKIVEITPEEIKYKKCATPDGPMYVTRKSDVFMIKYSNGLKETFKEEPKVNKAANNTSNYTKKEHTSAILSLIFGILGIVVLFGSIPAIILGVRALKAIKENPNKYSGEGLAKAGIALGVIKMAIVVLFFLIIIAAI